MNSISRSTKRNFVLGEVTQECTKQDIKWGQQDHIDGTGGELLASKAVTARHVCDNYAKHGGITWRHILDEEFCEAMAESDEALLRAELVQVAAVAVQWIASIDRRKK